MPRKNVWIREEDIDIWDGIDNRSDWMHEALNTYSGASQRTIKLPQFDKPIKIKKDVTYCKNGHVADEWGRCINKLSDCKYGR